MKRQEDINKKIEMLPPTWKQTAEWNKILKAQHNNYDRDLGRYLLEDDPDAYILGVNTDIYPQEEYDGIHYFDARMQFDEFNSRKRYRDYYCSHIDALNGKVSIMEEYGLRELEEMEEIMYGMPEEMDEMQEVNEDISEGSRLKRERRRSPEFVDTKPQSNPGAVSLLELLGISLKDTTLSDVKAAREQERAQDNAHESEIREGEKNG